MSDSPTRSDAPSGRAQWLGLLLAPAAFVVVAGYNYLVAPLACQVGSGAGSVIGILGFVITAAGLLVALWGGYLAYQNHQRARRAGDTASDSGRFMSVGGIMLTVLFTGLTLLVGLSSLALQPCRPV